MDTRKTLVTYAQAAKLTQPRDGSFNHPNVSCPSRCRAQRRAWPVEFEYLARADPYDGAESRKRDHLARMKASAGVARVCRSAAESLRPETATA